MGLYWWLSMRLLLILVAFVALLGQTSGLRFPALQQAIGISDLQLRQLEQACPTTPIAGYPRVPECTLRFLNPAQRAKVSDIAQMANRRDAATEAVSLGLMRSEEWPFVHLCPHPIRAQGSVFGLTEDQIFRLWQEADMAKRRAMLDDSQKKQLAALQSDLQVATEALRVGLISCPMCGGECSMCQ
jgi:hypothetical protein